MKRLLALVGLIASFCSLSYADVLSVTPAPGATGVAANAVVSITFDEPMDPASFTEKRFRLQKTKKPHTHKWVRGSVSYDPETYTATFQPYGDLEEGEYLAIVKNQVKNECGKRIRKKHFRWKFTVERAPLVSLVASPKLRILVTTSAQLSAVGYYEDGTTRELADRVRWAVSDSALASIDDAGVFTALKTGTVTMWATDPASGIVSNNIVAYITNKVMRVDLAPAALELTVGDQTAVSVMALYYDDTYTDALDKADFIAGDYQVVSVADDGTVTALQPGTTTLYVRVEGIKSNVVTITVAP